MRSAAIGLSAGLLSGLLVCSACTSGSSSPKPTSTTTSSAGATTTPAGTPTNSTTTPTTAPATSSATSSAPTKRTVSILGSGDVLVHPQLTAQAKKDAQAEGKDGYDFSRIYASIAPDSSAADVATCEMETPLAPPQGPFIGYPTFNAPPQVLTALKGVGYDSCTTASNHSLDQGYTGVKRTLDELDAAGLKHTGSARTAAEAATPLIITTAGGVKVGQLAYAFGFNGLTKPAGKPWLANEIDVPAIIKAAKAAKQAGADVVVVSMHWGVEYDHLATALQKQQAEQLLASPYIDLILGAHSHVVQPAQQIHGKWVFYGMGNQISRHANPIAVTRQGVMPFVTFTEQSPGHFVTTSAQVIPTWMQDSPDLRLIDIPRALASSTTPAAQLADDRTARAAIAKYIDAYGAVKSGLVVR